MTAGIVFFLADCPACATRYAVMTEPFTGCQLWYDRRYYPNNPIANVAGDGYHCPQCDARLSGGLGVLLAGGEWLNVGADAAKAGLS